MVSPADAQTAATKSGSDIIAARKKGLNSLRIDLAAPIQGTGLAIPL